MESEEDDYGLDEVKMEKITATGTKRVQSYVSQTAVALRCRVMPPPCIKNPYIKDASEMDRDPFGNQRSKCAGKVVDSILRATPLLQNMGRDMFSYYFLEGWEIFLRCNVRTISIVF